MTRTGEDFIACKTVLPFELLLISIHRGEQAGSVSCSVTAAVVLFRKERASAGLLSFVIEQQGIHDGT